jgi:hypothetical protein
MTSEYIIAQRLGQFVPRSILWPPYCAMNPYFTELSDSIDTVWGDLIDNGMKALVNIRNVWVTNPAVEQTILNTQLFALPDWSIPERATLVKQVNMLGMKLQNAGILTDQNYLVISRFLGMYWFQKGTQAFMQFINFVSELNLTVQNMWSQNTPNPLEYNNLTVENADGTPPGTPIWEGGTWWPTTHVVINALGGINPIAASTIGEFFYEIANYNLVLDAINDVFYMPLVTRPQPAASVADIVALGCYRDHAVALSTEGRFGGSPPTITAVQPGLTTSVFSNGTPDYNTAYLMAAPNSWFLNDDGQSIPLYGTSNQTAVNSITLPTTMMGPPNGPANNPSSYVMLLGPVTFMPYPGLPTNEYSGGVPVWTAVPTVYQPSVISTQTVGNANVALLANPTGWIELYTGYYTPYW